jgi:hypothetical protein
MYAQNLMVTEDQCGSEPAREGVSRIHIKLEHDTYQANSQP